MTYTIPSQEELLKVSSSLIPKVVKGNDKYWFVKYKPGSVGEEKRDYLGYLLGQNICNIAEVKLLTSDEHEEVKTFFGLPVESTVNDTFLVRFAESYSLEELPCKTIEKATATELVYSIWIRRRDTHADNRGYTKDGVPVFFDFHVAFLGEPYTAHSTVFFKHAPDYGHPAFWRVKQSPGIITTSQARFSVTSPSNKAWHYVNDLNQFGKEIGLAEESIRRSLSSIYIHDAIVKSGFNPTEIECIEDFLAKNLITLSIDIEEMKKIIFR